MRQTQLHEHFLSRKFEAKHKLEPLSNTSNMKKAKLSSQNSGNE